MKGTFVSIWDGGTEITTNCNVELSIRKIIDVDCVNVNVDILDEEYINVGENRYKVLRFDEFKELWLEQETLKCDDIKQLQDEIDVCNDFDDLFQVISLWSNVPLIERVNNFLIRNNSFYIED